MHTLAIADVYFKLVQGDLGRFYFEPRYEYTHRGKKLIYAPDALLEYNKKLYIIEVQLSSYSKNQWSNKWKNANVFFTEHYKTAAYQIYSKIVKPYFIAVTTSSYETASHGFNVPDRKLIVVKDISEITR